ncbi:MAG TPA: hypothetical protein VNL13_06260 [Sulfolobales archaeon]|nr:hypothetical protein [Sulfolobales archaeon]
MSNIAGFGTLEHNVAIALGIWEQLERMLGELYDKLSRVVFTSEKILLKYLSEMCEKHAEYIARLYYEYEAMEKRLSPEELREIDRASRKVLRDIEEVYLRARNLIDPLELALAIEEMEKMCDVVRDSYNILREHGDGEAWYIGKLIDMITSETRIRREVLGEVVKRLGSR